MVKKSILLLTGLLLAAGLCAEPVLSNAVVSQRVDTNLVDLTYDLSGAGPSGATIDVELSDDSGATYNLVASSLSGDSGSYIFNGTDKQIVWDAGSDKPDFASDTMRFRISATEEWPFPVPVDVDQFVFVPAASFTMGDAQGELANAPAHQVSVSGFYMGKYEVTWSLWQEVRTWAVSNGYDLSGAGIGKADTHPVHSANWYEAVKWCNAASERAGLDPVYYLSQGGGVYRSGESAPYIDYSKQGYRLPTEAEWEKAARGGLSGKRFPWGDTISNDDANYRANGSRSSYDVSTYTTDTYHPDYDNGATPYTAPVGSFAANDYGLYDTAGNLREWCNDRYDGSYYSNSPGSDPTGPTTGSKRVRRGGGWLDIASNCRVAHRGNLNPASRNHNCGFRLVLIQ